jgi:hypothetical protein
LGAFVKSHIETYFTRQDVVGSTADTVDALYITAVSKNILSFAVGHSNLWVSTCSKYYDSALHDHSQVVTSSESTVGCEMARSPRFLDGSQMALRLSSSYRHPNTPP